MLLRKIENCREGMHVRFNGRKRTIAYMEHFKQKNEYYCVFAVQESDWNDKCVATLFPDDLIQID